MSKGYELEGTIYQIDDIQTFNSGFTKREFVVEAMDGQYSQQIKFEAVKEKTSLTDGLQKGDAIKVSFDIRGNEHNGRFYVNLNAWKVEKAGAGGSAPAGPPASGDAVPADDGGAAPPSHEREAPPGALDNGTEDDIPF